MEMFYSDSLDPILRFGDVLKGFIKTEPKFNNPILSMDQKIEYNINVSIPEFSVVLTPCCSIGPSIISLTPLIKVLTTFMKNPHFKEDLTRINRIVDLPKNKFTPVDWETLDKDEKLKHVDQGKSYTFLNNFIYEPYIDFTSYELKGEDIKYYMVDFTRSYYINCGNIKREGKTDGNLIESKVLQLSLEVRNQLRNKIAEYYNRIPEEDKVCAANV